MSLRIVDENFTEENSESKEEERSREEVAIDEIHAYFSESEYMSGIKTNSMADFMLVMKTDEGYLVAGAKPEYEHLVAFLEESKQSLLIAQFASGGTL